MYAAYKEQTHAMGNSCGTDADVSTDTPTSKDGTYPRPNIHHNCTKGVYPRTEDDPKNRCEVPEEKVSWDVEFPEYEPIEFFAVQPVPIPEDPDFRESPDPETKWNEKSDVNRQSHQGDYEIVNNVPRNPVGRTGMVGRGTLARWGPNHAADPIVTRWKMDEKGEVVKHESSEKPVLQFVSIQRGDCGLWALPGGFVDGGEEANNALKREFLEETMDSEGATEEQKQEMKEKCKRLFQNGVEVYRGYVDDPRNTDQAWMETTAVNFHDDTGDLVGQLNLHAGDDAVGVKWQDMSSELELYASHKEFVYNTAMMRKAHW